MILWTKQIVGYQPQTISSKTKPKQKEDQNSETSKINKYLKRLKEYEQQSVHLGRLGLRQHKAYHTNNGGIK